MSRRKPGMYSSHGEALVVGFITFTLSIGFITIALPICLEVLQHFVDNVVLRLF